ncbi:hypothetical protein GRX01_07810 [Halobaculum sp. WSA2]|uniref:ROS/MUCR transcriptional regulator protein n=1 Tax=Halobaculum saliterrae TaxID=2073113 RepID=A0A6B0SX83_9EURY|nr:hypothetical protein [Halobaculum saliterrae]MXR41241.1 hypothetical protein [Halobaculum saliterrae]
MTADDDRWAKYETQPDEIDTDAPDDMVVCRVCSGTYGQITAQHLRVHGMTLKEYRQEHSDAPIYPDHPDRQPGGGFEEHTEESKEKISEAIFGLHQEGHYE